MDITWLGHACIRLRGKEGTVLMDPCGRSTGYTIGKQTADIVTTSQQDAEHSSIESISLPYRLLNAPGEYEVGGILVRGIQTHPQNKDGNGAKPARNVAFVVELDDLRVCHLGDLDHTPKQSEIEELSDIDVLLTSVGGHGALDAAGAAEVISMLEPRVVVPLRYQTESAALPLDPLETFVKQMGIPVPTSQAKFTVARSTLPEGTQVVVLEYRK